MDFLNLIFMVSVKMSANVSKDIRGLRTMRNFFFAVLAGGFAAAALSAPAMAGDRSGGVNQQGGAHQKSEYYRGGPQVRGYSARRGGYSYSYEDTINTYGDSRTNYGSTSVFRDPKLDRQTNSGPFDHGFFFDGGVAPRGGDAPYLN